MLLDDPVADLSCFPNLRYLSVLIISQWARVLRAANTITSNLHELVLVMMISEYVVRPEDPPALTPAILQHAELDRVFAEHAALAQLDATLTANNFRQLEVVRCYFSVGKHPKGDDERRATHQHIMGLFREQAPRLYDREILTVDLLQYVPARKHRRRSR